MTGDHMTSLCNDVIAFSALRKSTVKLDIIYTFIIPIMFVTSPTRHAAN